uniref:Integrase, catalytic region, zinc finger, CCHC-type, peptidase aspartic, catalytic n=1 Tax=Tanacetum cinerariifolium TaxID=118510 RepID=A0A6L2KQ72_TANCI|nr:hypothetical protein [Tanacetum cinerariifolium]
MPWKSGLVYYSGGLSGEYTVLAVCQIVHYASGLSSLTARFGNCSGLIRGGLQVYLKTFSHTDLGNKPLPILFHGSGLVFLLHSGLPILSNSGKENEVNILKSIGEGPFKMGMFRETLTEGEEGALHLGPERPRVYFDLSPEEKDRYNADIRATNVLLQGSPKDIYTLINYYTDAKDIWDNVKMLMEGSKLTKEDHESQRYDDFEHFRQHKGETIHDYYVRFVTVVKLNRGLRDFNYDQLYAYLKQHEAHDNKNKMMLDRFTQNTVDPLTLMSNVSHQQYYSQSYTTLPSTSVQPHFGQGNNVRGDGAAGYERAQNRVRNVKSDKMLLMQAQENGVALDEEQLLFIVGGQDKAVDEDTMFMENLSSADHVYDEASPSYDSDILSEELHSVKMQLTSTINHSKSMVEEVTSWKKDFKQKENKYLKEFFDMKALKEKVKDKLYKQDQSLQTVHMLCKPKSYYDEQNKETLEIAEITRKKMNDKMKDPKCVQKKFKIAPHDYLKENYLATFTPQKQLTPEKIFWSKDLLKMKVEALKEQTIASRPIKALMVKHDKIKRKNLLIVNDNLIVDCLSKDVFYTATDYVLTISRFSAMHENDKVIHTENYGMMRLVVEIDVVGMIADVVDKRFTS